MRRRIEEPPLDLIVAALVAAHLLFSLASAAFVLHFHILSASSVSRRRRRLLGLNSLWPVRLLLVLFGSLWSSAELLIRFPFLIPPSPALCRTYSLTSQSFAEPCFFATLLFLLRASTQPKPSISSSFAAALASAIAAAFPFLLVHSLLIAFSPWALRHLRLPEDVLGSASYAVGGHQRCTYPLFGTVLLAALGSVYVPLFVSACWGAVTVVINKRLRIRLYALAAAVVVALSVQVSALALSALWAPGGAASQGLALTAFVAVLSCVAAGEGILVVQPVVDALAIVHPTTTFGSGSCGMGMEEGRSTCAPRATADSVVG